MVIERIHISTFGTLSDRDLDFGSGVNILEGENESGKTTVAAFLRFLFYGFSGDAEREQYSAFPRGEGRTDIVLGGWLDCRISGKEAGDGPLYCRVSRTVPERDASLTGSAEIYDLQANARIYEGQEPWQVFFGVPAEVFVSTAFVRQITASDPGKNAFPVGTGVSGSVVRTAMENILSSADAETDPERAAAQLNARRALLYDPDTNSGVITELEKQRETLAEHITAAEEGVRNAGRSPERAEAVPNAENDAEIAALEQKIGDARARIAQNDARSAKLEAVREKYETYRLLDRIGELTALREKKRNVSRRAEALCETMFRSEEIPDEHFADDLRQAAADMAAARTEADNAAEAVRLSVYSSRHDALWAQLISRAEEDGGPDVIRKTVRSLQGSRARSAVFGALSFLLTVFGLSGSVFLLVVRADIAGLFVLFTVLMAVMSLILLISHSNASKNLAKILSRYGCKSEETLERFLDEYLPSVERLDRNSTERTAAAAAHKESSLAYDVAADDAAALLRRLQPPGAPPISADRLTPELVRRASEQLDKTLAEISALDAKAEAYEEQIRATAQLLGSDDEEELNEKRSALADELRAAFGGKEPDEKGLEPVLRELDFNLKANKALVEKISLLGQRLDKLRSMSDPSGQRAQTPENDSSSYAGEDPEVYAHLLERLDETLQSERRKYQALRLASAALRRAGTRFRENLAPQLMKNAGVFLRVLSDGQYSELTFDGGLYVNVPSEEGGHAFPVAYMSAGTQDLAFLCLRLALVGKLFERDIPPMLFDDAFTVLDDKHLVRVIDLLSAISKENGTQFLILTCHKREHRIAAGLSKEHTCIEL